jgi:surface carbohydrate biosynthesis protein (TIGR04326 family)
VILKNFETIEIVTSKKKNKSFVLKEYYEKNSEEIKNEIILFIASIKRQKINNLKFKKFLSFDKDFSIWDLSLVNEKNVYKSNAILNLIKFITIKKILKKKVSKKIILKNFDEKFVYKFKKTEIYKKKKFEFICIKNYKKDLKEKILSKINNSIILSILYFVIFSLKNLSFRGYDKIDITKIKSIFFNYFTQYDQKKFEQGKFCPKQWPNETYKLNDAFWINIFLPNKEFKNIHQINNFIKKKKIKNILFINNFLNLNILFKILKTYLVSLYKFCFFVQKFKYKKKNDNDHLLFLKEDIKKSLCCFYLLENLAYHYLIQNLLEKINNNNNNNNKIFYLFENQPWEKSLIFNSKNLNLLKVYAYSHTTINYWHLNYFNTKIDNKNYLNNYLPKTILCHSENCRQYLLNQGYSSNQLLKVSAERFRWATKKKKINIFNSHKKILVIGDYEKRINLNLLNIVNHLANTDSNGFKYSITYKPHPSTFYNQSFLNVKVFITRKNLNEILDNFEIIVSTNSTAASAEISLAKKKILIFLDHFNIDLSPFKLKNNFKNNFNFFDHNDLKKLLFYKNKIKNIQKYNFYFKKKYKDNWRKLFK